MVLLVRKAIFKLVFLNKLVILCVSGLWYILTTPAHRQYQHSVKSIIRYNSTSLFILSTLQLIHYFKFHFICCRISRLYIRSRKHTADTNCILKIIQTKFYQQHLHKYLNLIIFNEILIIPKLHNFSEVQLHNSLRMIQIYRNM